MINHSTDTIMRYDKGLPKKRKLIPKSAVKTARLVRNSLEEQDEYLRKRRMKEEDRCLRCGTNKKFTIKEWNECPWQLADWRASVDFPLLPRFIVHWWYFKNNPKHLTK